MKSVSFRLDPLEPKEKGKGKEIQKSLDFSDYLLKRRHNPWLTDWEGFLE